ncbi:MAG: AAA family ATPase [Lachnospiraceae bacterium]|nr:AAA family ATPase [Lachnospiraceae bacterium]
MAKNVAIGIQSFSKLIENDCFYVDKTDFIREWWDSKDEVTLIARPRRFGKTLNMSMTEQFFSLEYAQKGGLFEGLSIWEAEAYRNLQGTYPVISLSFAAVKETCFSEARKSLCRMIEEQYNKYEFLLEKNLLNDKERAFYQEVTAGMSDSAASAALRMLSDFLYRLYGKKVIILLDEYDTPMQEAYINGYWNEMVSFIRTLFNSAFKTNPWLERALLTGITRVSKESVFSDLNNLKVVTATSEEYASCFGFTEKEVFLALDQRNMGDKKEQIKLWYDGFIFGSQRDIYNPWSILNFLDTGKFSAYWANTSSNSLVSRLLRESSPRMKETFEELIRGGTLRTSIDEQMVFSQLDSSEEAIWSLFLASGYLKVLHFEDEIPDGLGEENADWEPVYELALTNLEVRRMFRSMIRGWFARAEHDYNDFIKGLLQGNVRAMNTYMNRVALQTFSYFDTGRNGSFSQPERFYHGFVLGLAVELSGRYFITSNRESGFGRYDVILEPKKPAEDDAVILEFKVLDEYDEKDLEDTVASALQQIKEKNYSAVLVQKGIPESRIRRYGFAFQGKRVLIGQEL